MSIRARRVTTVHSTGITRLQLEILRCMARGMEQKEIAEELEYAVGTIHSYRSRLLKQLHARNSAHAVAIAYERGWLKGTVALPEAA